MIPIIDADAANRARVQTQYPVIRNLDHNPQVRVYDADREQHRISLRGLK